MDKKKKFCFREVDFYKEGYIAVLLINGDDEKKFLYPMLTVYKDLKALVKEVKDFKKHFKNRKPDLVDVYGALVIKIKFNRPSPLKKEFWETKSDMTLDNTYRMKQYLKMLNDGQKLYQIIVMPRHFEIKKKKWILTNLLPVLLSITDEELGKIAVMSSGTEVDISAKNMGLYTIEWVKGFDITNEELIEYPNNTENNEFNC